MKVQLKPLADQVIVITGYGSRKAIAHLKPKGGVIVTKPG